MSESFSAPPLSLDVVLSPAEIGLLKHRDLSQTCCVVFDVLRATSSMVVALANGAEGILPCAEIADALDAQKRHPDCLLAGERDGRRITPGQANGTGFHLGNSPSEFTPEMVNGRLIAMTTTNGTRALNACAGARETLIASFLNLQVVVEHLMRTLPGDALLVCSGTREGAAMEDILGAGAVCDAIWDRLEMETSDATLLARELFVTCRDHLSETVSKTANALRLLGIPELADDVAFCLHRDTFPILAAMDAGGVIRQCGSGFKSEPSHCLD